MKRCENCYFWVSEMDQPRNRKALEEGEGECRRRAPTGGGITAYFAASKTPNKMIALVYPWPVSHKNDWCGQYEQSTP